MVEAYLVSRSAQTLFLASNLARSGFQGEGRYGGTFLGVFQLGQLRGLAQLVNMGSLLVSVDVPDAVPPLVSAVLEQPVEPVRFLGMANELGDFLTEYRRSRPVAPRFTRECVLQSLSPENLAVPSTMRGFRAATLDDVELLLPWVRGFHEEELREDPARIDEAALRATLEDKVARGGRYLLEEDGVAVSTLAISAEASGMVQVGGVFTPRELRGRGHATRLLACFAHFHLNGLGARRVVLQVGEDNHPALRAYEKVGFRTVGRYHFVFCDG